MGLLIYPSHNDVADAQGIGNRLTESKFRGMIISAMGRRNGVVSGFTQTNPSGLTVRLAIGVALINGQYVDEDSATDITATDNATSYQHLYIVRDGNGRATGIAGSSASSISTSLDYVLISKTIASSGTITTLDDARASLPGVVSGTYVGDNSSGAIDLGRTPTLVMVSAESSTNRIFSISSIDAPGNRIGPNSGIPQSRVYFKPAVKSNSIYGVYTGSKTWAPTINAGAEGTTTLTISGVTTSMGAITWHTDNSNARFLEWYNYVTATDTVSVWARNDTTSQIILSGTLYARVFDHTATITSDCEFYENTVDALYAPYIVEDGFDINYSAASLGINDTGVVYNYIAFFG